jgi:hypothetical protein
MVPLAVRFDIDLDFWLREGLRRFNVLLTACLDAAAREARSATLLSSKN